MKNVIKIGSLVNVDFIVTKSWESEAGVVNCRVFDVDEEKQTIGVIVDSESKKKPYNRLLQTGHYSTLGYAIELIK
tara:strand:- start:85 stop:312 length:228 start_codon:yes stop_codon:yes gene_type:complete